MDINKIKIILQNQRKDIYAMLVLRVKKKVKLGIIITIYRFV